MRLHSLFTLFGIILYANGQLVIPFVSQSLIWNQIMEPNSTFYRLASKESGQVLSQIKNTVFSFSNPSKLQSCSSVKNHYKGLCRSKRQVVYINEQRAPIHTFRTFVLPAIATGSSVVTFGLQQLVCFNKGDLLNIVADLTFCNALGYQALYNDVIAVGLTALAYQNVYESPFSDMAVRILNVFSSMGFSYTGFSAVGEDNKVVPLSDMDEGFPLKYIFTNYGTPETRNASLAIFTGNTEKELGFSFISKPWDADSTGGAFNTESYDWKYVLKLDMDEFNYHLDRMSPEEILLTASQSVMSFKDFILFGGGLWSNKAEIFVEIGNHTKTAEGERENENKEDDQNENFVEDDDTSEVFFRNLHGLNIRVSLEKGSVHTLQW